MRSSHGAINAAGAKSLKPRTRSRLLNIPVLACIPSAALASGRYLDTRIDDL